MEPQEMEDIVKKLQAFAWGNGRVGADETLRKHDALLQQIHDDGMADKVKAMWSWMKDQRDREKMRTAALYSAALGGLISGGGTIILLITRVL